MLVLMTSFTFMSAGVCARLQITVVLKLQNAQKKKKARKCVSGNVKETFKKNGKNECCEMWVVKTVRGRGESS